MRIKDGYVLRTVGGENVVIAVGAAAEDFKGMMKLNATGRIVWEGLADGDSEGQIAARIVDAYDVDEATAAEDVRAMVAGLTDAGFVE